MPEASRSAPGGFCWAEVAVNDPGEAKKFYGELFGWEAREVAAGEAGTYTILSLGGKDIGGLYPLSEEQRSSGVPPHWLSYVAVGSVDESTEKARSLGGQVMMEPMDVMDIGRMSLLQDPTGAVFALWESRREASWLSGVPGSVCWNELMTRGPSAAVEFYCALFGWDARQEHVGEAPYTLLMRGETTVGGLMEIPKEMGETPSHWMIYFAVEECDAAAARAESLGGKTLVPPTDIPTVGRFAVLNDPAGASFGILQLEPALRK